ncbi:MULTISPECIES: hypothetical protein [unclassified Campylobacter]|uniref:hypothetical protein n=1 Tax=unclassified Campylobacter TaxID=2593542 RepID=UPI0022E99DA9|nr:MULTISPECIES: hypothetical protein [unclassified Campylobacter]MDA3054562.1 hypothetical protein [Campylobacter sp. VBCF_07 NA4]MDA3060654.1 hypothetical protein [Campylobacter sp. VBCF_02 NA5]MDA3070080.1 hypothetical protein [Campylobacter sp. VBCF_08 NA3]WBR54517.1 hypothetical protein PF027_01215 [Campylobacter sp. VBCF_01 NA2]
MDLTKFLGYKPFFDYYTILDIINDQEHLRDICYCDYAYAWCNGMESNLFVDMLMYSALIGIIYVFIVVIVNLLLKREKMDITALSAHFAFGFFCLGWCQNLLLFTIATLLFIILPIKIIYYQDLKFAFKDTIKSFRMYFVILIPIAMMFVGTFKHKELEICRKSFMYIRHYPAYDRVDTFSDFIEKWRE